MSASIRPLIAAAALTAALAACDDPYAVEAQLEVVTDTFAAFGINEAPTGAPSAYSLFGNTVLAASGSYNFDFAFDVREGGRVAVIPNNRLAGGLVGGYRVGIQRITGNTFEGLQRAPLSGYAYDSTFVLQPGDAIVIDSQNPTACPIAFYGTSIYGKLVIDSVRTNPGRVFFRTTVDRNCGFRSLAPGLPRD